ncbi:MAG: hypothetical protein N3F04_01485 [Candidatus Nezhaarchaeota archaeon]|nr:hypothetical protein [Candidatus Nezhaarchaeota archaeon]MCX8141450.1 hypothetical protein [Candidatus Nezhaarchaeota archaeon]MDW8049716.1 hypothetical protein [Nitrososphaerota archaeon]
MNIVEKFSRSLAHIEALYMYVNRGALKNQCLEELEARWPGLGYKAWNDVEEEASKLEPQILVGDLKRYVINVIEEKYGKELAKEVNKRIQSLKPDEFRVVVAFSRLWMSGFKTTDEDELSMTLEACLNVRGKKAIEVLWRTGLINRAHRSSTSRYIPKIYVPKYVEEVLAKYSYIELRLDTNVREALEKSLAEHPLKACIAVYGLQELIDELVQAMTGLPLSSVLYKLSINGVVKAGRPCPLLREEILKWWRQLTMNVLLNCADVLKALKTSGYIIRELYDEHMNLPLILSYRDGLRMAFIAMPAILPLKQVRNFNPGVPKIILTPKVNAPLRETLQMLRSSSIVHVSKKVTVYGGESVEFLAQVLRSGGLELDVQQV